MGQAKIDKEGPLSQFRSVITSNFAELYQRCFDNPLKSSQDKTTSHYAKRTDAKGAGIKANIHAEFIADFEANQIGASILGDATNTGDAETKTGYVAGVVGRASDKRSGKLPLVGVAGWVESKGVKDNRTPVLGIYKRSADAPLGEGSVSVFVARPEICESNGVNPDNTGEVVLFDASHKIKGSDPDKRYALKGANGARIDVDGLIEAKGGLSVTREAPKGEDAPGVVGEVATDATFIYWCYEPNKWNRAKKEIWE